MATVCFENNIKVWIIDQLIKNLVRYCHSRIVLDFQEKKHGQTMTTSTWNTVLCERGMYYTLSYFANGKKGILSSCHSKVLHKSFVVTVFQIVTLVSYTQCRKNRRQKINVLEHQSLPQLRLNWFTLLVIDKILIQCIF